MLVKADSNLKRKLSNSDTRFIRLKISVSWYLWFSGPCPNTQFMGDRWQL